MADVMCGEGSQPLVSVVISVFNSGAFLKPALDSILQQTLKNVEYIIIDDGSTDGSGELILQYAAHDERIRCVSHAVSRGLPTSLNEAIELATGKFIARMDSDDVALPERLEKQVTFLEAHPEIGIIGTWAREINEHGVLGRAYTPPTEQALILWRACFANPFLHPTVMVRAKVFKAHKYNETFNKSQDFELWSRLLFQEGIIPANLPEILLRYRRHSASLTKTKKPAELERSARIPLENIKTFYQLTPAQEELFIRAYTGQRLRFSELWSRLRLSFAIKNTFVTLHPEVRGKLRFIIWRDVWFFTKYAVKQLIRG